MLSLGCFVYGIASFIYFVFFIFSRKSLVLIARRITFLGVILIGIGILIRWFESYKMGIGHAPLSNLYESLIFFSWIVVLISIFIEKKYKELHISIFVLPIAFLAIGYASFSSDIDGSLQPIVPALKSNWLVTHVVTCFLGYASFTISFIFSLIYLIRKKISINYFDFFYHLTDIYVLEQVNYQLVMFGIFFLSIGIITGSIWANSAWGSYWSWDPKETWSLITWLIYAVLIHVRLVKNWSGEKIAYISIIGFISVLFTYFGVNFLHGLHSYTKI